MARLRTARGFTIIELMIVVTMIGILSTIALPYYQKMTAKAYRAEAQAILPKVRTHFTNTFENQANYGLPDMASHWNPDPAVTPPGTPVNWNASDTDWKDIPYSADGGVRMRYQYVVQNAGTQVTLRACGSFPGLNSGTVPCGSLTTCGYCYSETIVGNSVDPTLTVEQPVF